MAIMTGRPKKEINWQLFEDLCSIQCTQSEIGSVMHLNVDTVHDRVKEHYGRPYSEVYKQYSEVGKSSLRRIQLKLAQKSAAMAIFLGKQYLGQKDNDHIIQIPPEMVSNYNRLMNQLGELQSKASLEKQKTQSLLQASA
jgi:hypothetical protein